MSKGRSWIARVAVFVITGGLACAAVKVDRFSGLVCGLERDAALAATDHDSPEARTVQRLLLDAVTLLRLHDTEAALARLGAVRRIVSERPSVFSRDSPSSLEASLDALSHCVTNAEPPALATLTVRVAEFDPAAPGDAGPPADAGAYIRADGIDVGRTGPSGTVTVRIPSGPVRVTAVVFPTSSGEEFLALVPGQAHAATIILDTGKEVAEQTHLVLSEATDGVLAASVESLTLRFGNDERPLGIVALEFVDLLDAFGGLEERITDLFGVEDGAIVAIDPQRVLAAAARYGPLIRLGATAIDEAGIWHHNSVEFRVE